MKVGFLPFGWQVASEVWFVFNHAQTIYWVIERRFFQKKYKQRGLIKTNSLGEFESDYYIIIG